MLSPNERASRVGSSPTTVEILDPVVLIRINQLYRPGMSAEALYEATRAAWKVGERRKGAKYALSVYDGVVREVYAIDDWLRAGSTPYRTRLPQEVAIPGRWEFTGVVASDEIRNGYRGRSVARYFERGNANPILYVTC